MNRRSFLGTAMLGMGGTLVRARPAAAALPQLKITRVRLYENDSMRLSFNQSSRIVTVETDGGITGIGEGGSRDTIMDSAPYVIGQNPCQTEYLWQRMYRGAFYPPGREKLHALGALDLALWDIKGKALDVPVHALLGGKTRDYAECYSTGFPRQGGLRETARACIEAGFRAFRTSVADPGADRPFDARQMVDETHRRCMEIREGVGPQGDWAIDYHTRLDLADAIRLSGLLAPLNPYFVEDLVRPENQEVYRTLREQVQVPIAVGEQFGDRWDINALIEQHLIDYSRVTLPNAGGITEFLKIAAICETRWAATSKWDSSAVWLMAWRSWPAHLNSIKAITW